MSQCSAHTACAAIALAGNCCPTVAGIWLSCCTVAGPPPPATVQSPPPTLTPDGVLPPSSIASPVSAQCAQHAQCSASGLSGDCCPTSTGLHLACCSWTHQGPPPLPSAPPPSNLPTSITAALYSRSDRFYSALEHAFNLYALARALQASGSSDVWLERLATRCGGFTSYTYVEGTYRPGGACGDYVNTGQWSRTWGPVPVDTRRGTYP